MNLIQKLPITGNMTNDFVLILFLVIIGVGLALKADLRWGWALVLLAFLWAFFMMRNKGLV